MSDKKIIVVSLVLLALVAGAAYFFEFQKNVPTATALAAIKSKAEKFINEQMVSPGTTATIKDIVEENGMYKVTVAVGSQDLTAYISKDGKNFFPSAYNMDSPLPKSNASVSAKPIAKSDVPTVELFVMSYCPYGVQIEKGILPVLDLFGSKINFNLKFVDYSLHGDKEITENLRQYCVQQQGVDKLENYLKCFVKQGDFSTCLSEAKIDSAKLASCTSATDSQFKITQTASDKNAWNGSQYPPFNINKAENTLYQVTGSPTLVINGTTVSTQRDPQSLLTSICAAFSIQPDLCSQKVSTTSPAAGFGDGSTAGASTSSCGN